VDKAITGIHHVTVIASDAQKNLDFYTGVLGLRLVPGELPDLSGTSVFLGAGRSDPVVPIENTERLAAMLRKAGAEVELFWHMGGHSLTQEEVLRAKQWLAK